jgi:hypothetical protein
MGSRSIYTTVTRAVIESSLISWMALLAYAISSTYDWAYAWLTEEVRCVCAERPPLFSLSQFRTFLPSGAIYTVILLAFVSCSRDIRSLLICLQGISQTLLVARIGLLRFEAHSDEVKHTTLAFARSGGTEIRTELMVKGRRGTACEQTRAAV